MKKFLILIASIFLLVSCEYVQEETYCIIVDKMYQKSYYYHTQVGGVQSVVFVEDIIIQKDIF